MKKNKQWHYFTAGAPGVSAPSVSCTTGPSGLNINNIVVNNTGVSANASASNNIQNGNLAGPPQAGSGIISQSSSTTNAGTTIAQTMNASHTKGGSSSVSSAAKKRNTIAGVPQAMIGTTPADLLGKQHQALSLGSGQVPPPQSKKVNNFMIDSSAYQSVHQHQPQPQTNNHKIHKHHQNQTACHSTKSSQGPHHHHQKTHSSGAATTKHSAMKNAKDWKFVERRLSAKILQQQEVGGGGSASNSVGPAKKANAIIANSSNSGGAALGGSKGSIQYENLMLQQLLKQQHKLDLEKEGAANGMNAGGAFKKNMSVISIDQPNQVATGVATSLGAPQMMLNISYNMNNNIDANSAAQFVFHQHPPAATNPANGSGIQNQGISNDPLGQVLAAAQQHQTLSNQYQQQIRTIIGLAAQGELPISLGGTSNTQGGNMVPNPTNGSAMISDHHLQQQRHQNTAATSATHPLMDAPSQAQYKTQVDTKKLKQGMIGANPYHTNASSSMLGEGMMTYENSIVQAVKHAEIKYREQSFDQIKKKRRSVNPSGAGGAGNHHSGSGAGRSIKQQLSNNSGRRATVGTSHKAISQQATHHPNSRSTSSKRKGDGKGSQTNNQTNFRGESSRGLLTSGHQNPSQQITTSAQQYHQSKKSVQKRSIEQAKLKVKGSFSQPAELQNHRTVSNHQAAATAPSHQGLFFPHPHPSSHVLTPVASSNTEKDRYLLYKLDEALESDLKDKASNQRVSICSKVWSEIIRRQDPVIASLLSKIKMNYEYHIKHQTKQLAANGQQHNTKEGNNSNEQMEKEIAVERDARKCAEEKAESLSNEVQRAIAQIKKQEDIIAEMKKQILGYRREIIDLSSHKKAYSIGDQSNNHHHNSKSEGRRVPRLDLSKLHRDSENIDENDDGESCVSIQDPLMEDENGKNVTYQQYLKFLENENRVPDPSNPGQVPPNFQQFFNQGSQLPPPDQLAEESQESLMRQEELKQRKNKIIQLLNGDISDEEGVAQGEEEEEDLEEQDESIQDEEYIDDEQNFEEEEEPLGDEGMFQQRMNVGQYTAELKKASQDFNNFHQVQPRQQVSAAGAHQVTEEDGMSSSRVNQLEDDESHQIDIVAAAKAAAKARGDINLKYHMIDKKQPLVAAGVSAPKGAQKNFQFEVFGNNQAKENQYSDLIQDILDNEDDEAYQEVEDMEGERFDAQRFLEEMERNEQQEQQQFMELDPETEQIIAQVNGKNHHHQQKQQLTRSNSS